MKVTKMTVNNGFLLYMVLPFRWELTLWSGHTSVNYSKARRNYREILKAEIVQFGEDGNGADTGAAVYFMEPAVGI